MYNIREVIRVKGLQMIENRFKVLLAEKETRERRSWSYRQIREATGVSLHTLSQYAQNKVTRFDAHIIEALCVFFDCEVGDLLVRVED